MTAPTITYVQPSLSITNLETNITIIGTNFDNSSVVSINGHQATTTTYVSATKVTAKIYTGILLEAENKVEVTTSGGTSSIKNFMKAGIS